MTNTSIDADERTPVQRILRDRRAQATFVLLVFSAVLRLAVAVQWQERAAVDVDGYLALARSINMPGTFGDRLSGEPTAFRPPLYPYVIVFLIYGLNGYEGIVRLQMLLGVATVGLTYRIARRLLHAGRSANAGSHGGTLGFVADRVAAASDHAAPIDWRVWVPSLIVAVDPLLLQYTTYAMTETLFTFLVTLLIDLVLRETDRESDEQHALQSATMRVPRVDSSDVPSRKLALTWCIAMGLVAPFAFYPLPVTRSPFVAFAALVAMIGLTVFRRHWIGPGTRLLPAPGRWPHQALIGIVFGLAALCRPTVWAFVGLMGIVTVWNIACPRSATRRRTLSRLWPTWVAAAIVVAPWLMRNQIQFGRPIFTTTHGGYTLLLGNNPVFNREVVDEPWGTVWEGESLRRWQASMLEEFRWSAELQRPFEELPAREREVLADAWYYRTAREYISNHPAEFARACLLRLRRFWSVAPIGPARDSIPPLILESTRIFYIVISIGLILFALRGRWRNDRRWIPMLLLVISLNAVHLVYWSNMRMRAPLIPVLNVMAVAGVCGGRWPAARNFVRPTTIECPRNPD